MNCTNDTLNADEMNKTSFAGRDDSERYGGTDIFDKNAFALPGAEALSSDAYDNLCSFFITLGNNSSKIHCYNLLHDFRRNCDATMELTKKFQSTDADLDHTTKTALKCFANLGLVKKSVTTSSGLTFNIFLEDARPVLQSQMVATHSKDICLETKINSVYSHLSNAETGQSTVPAAKWMIKWSS